MKTITIWFMIIALKKAIETKEKETNSILISAYEILIKNYSDTIMLLKAERTAKIGKIKNKLFKTK
jgi:ABC-type polysaccharide/polyol phosphate transport system ATPase subunit